VSTKALFWALEQNLPGGPKSVLVHLADWYNSHESAAWPTHEQLAEKCGWGRRTVQRHIEWLVEHQLVVKEKQMRGNFQIQNRYRLPVNVLVLQGSQIGAADVDSMAQQGGQADAPINTIKDTIKNTIKSGKPQTEEILDVKTVVNKFENPTRENILSAAKRKDGILIPDGCAYLWRNCRANAADTNGFQAELLVREKKMLHNAYKRVGEKFPATVWAVMARWVAFTKYAEQHGEAFNLPLKPTIPFFIKFIEQAVNFMEREGKSKTEGFVQLIAKKPKPLTKPSAPSKKAPEAISTEELLAMNKDIYK
jgi:hypothetical protein